jgi:hypothetical protein
VLKAIFATDVLRSSLPMSDVTDLVLPWKSSSVWLQNNSSLQYSELSNIITVSHVYLGQFL